ncbi:MAG: HAD-IIB family hydrolase [Pseudomonadota bacterium]
MKDLRDLLVFTDLDGTLLDHETYSWAEAAPALDVLRKGGAGLILASSKTAAEMAPLRAELGFSDWPAIVENGSGLLTSEADDKPYRRLRDAIGGLPQGFRGFGDMDAGEVSDRTGLSPEAAVRAKARQFSEPGLWTGAPDALAEFLKAAESAGLTAQQGGRFLTLSFGGNKADRVKELIQRYNRSHSIALGDAPNDAAMLEVADIGVIVSNPGANTMPHLPGEDTGRIRRTKRPGPAGWSDAVLEIVEELEDKKDKRAHG